MGRLEVANELKSIIAEYLKGQNLDLVDLIYRYEGNNLFLRVLVDRPEGGISLGECASLNRSLGNILDEKDLMRQRYILEVSSPGLDWPLISKSDFFRCLNKEVKFFLKTPLSGKWELQGIISKVQNDAVCIDIENSIIEIPLSAISKAKQVA